MEPRLILSMDKVWTSVMDWVENHHGQVLFLKQQQISLISIKSIYYKLFYFVFLSNILEFIWTIKFLPMESVFHRRELINTL